MSIFVCYYGTYTAALEAVFRMFPGIYKSVPGIIATCVAVKIVVNAIGCRVSSRIRQHMFDVACYLGLPAALSRAIAKTGPVVANAYHLVWALEKNKPARFLQYLVTCGANPQHFGIGWYASTGESARFLSDAGYVWDDVDVVQAAETGNTAKARSMAAGNLALALPDYYFNHTLNAANYDDAVLAVTLVPQIRDAKVAFQTAQAHEWRAICTEALAARLSVLPEGPFVQKRRWAARYVWLAVAVKK